MVATAHETVRPTQRNPDGRNGMRRFLVVAVSATLLAGAGCSTLGKAAFKEPKVELQDVKVTGIGFNGGSLDVLLNVDNPNEFRLDATQLDYDVVVGDSVRFATGTVSN